jgi:hypothetical protein
MQNAKVKSIQKKLYQNETLALVSGCRERFKNHFDRECKNRFTVSVERSASNNDLNISM